MNFVKQKEGNDFSKESYSCLIKKKMCDGMKKIEGSCELKMKVS